MEQICSTLWGVPEPKSSKKYSDDEEKCIKTEILMILRRSKDSAATKSVKVIESLTLDANDWEANFDKIRLTFLKTSNMIRNIKDTTINFLGLADILYFYALTFTYFQPYKYGTCESPEVQIRECDICLPNKYEGLGNSVKQLR
jgi:hypothetical protein